MKNLIKLKHSKYDWVFIIKKNESPLWYFRVLEREITQTNAKVIFDLNKKSENLEDRFYSCDLKNKVFDFSTFTKLTNLSNDLLQAIVEAYEK
ncbi:hypothetical protein SSABA_v1c01960 [Spiroplasma sabaudiense Ar-1343]|uniref:Uncharacterized protein n=1 Tax=Spiroplasma sabaudiense Ar-1343 TaxID=1276257 RepID=W6A8Y1_9MOLU|nr:type II toxin-antitoxin system RnlB family antitoxin [Spiroplasma sabaudiense]AHI53608.1 hypothetical protein SSABA_v1c01960 [Spiroplasma sabaudiense Ar-1343]